MKKNTTTRITTTTMRMMIMIMIMIMMMNGTYFPYLVCLFAARLRCTRNLVFKTYAGVVKKAY